jgi:two-component system, sensor histidine kinase and response regulator
LLLTRCVSRRQRIGIASSIFVGVRVMAPNPKDVIGSAITRAQAELVEALSELEKLSSFGTGTVAYATHALNNYLAVTGAAVQLISRRLADHPDTQILEWLDGVKHATDMMGNLVGQIMTASVSSQTRLRFEKVDLALSVRRFCDFYQEMAGRKLITLILDTDDDAPPVWTDRVAILSVLDNLASNAIKYSAPGKHVWMGVRSEGDSVVCVVRDEGPGLTQGDQAKLFQKGVRLTPRPTAGESSTGYGLAVARDLMVELGGEIWCESVLGEGTTFSVRLPAYQETVHS